MERQAAGVSPYMRQHPSWRDNKTYPARQYNYGNHPHAITQGGSIVDRRTANDKNFSTCLTVKPQTSSNYSNIPTNTERHTETERERERERGERYGMG